MFTHHSQRYLKAALKLAGWKETRSEAAGAELDDLRSLGFEPTDDWPKFMNGFGALELKGERPERGVVSFVLGSLEAADVQPLAAWTAAVGSPLVPLGREGRLVLAIDAEGNVFECGGEGALNFLGDDAEEAIECLLIESLLGRPVPVHEVAIPDWREFSRTPLAAHTRAQLEAAGWHAGYRFPVSVLQARFGAGGFRTPECWTALLGNSGGLSVPHPGDARYDVDFSYLGDMLGCDAENFPGPAKRAGVTLTPIGDVGGYDMLGMTPDGRVYMFPGELDRSTAQQVGVDAVDALNRLLAPKVD